MKELPWFKFYPAGWANGKITLCSYEAQGLFANLCSLYWSQSGNIRLADAKDRHSKCSASVWKELISRGVLKVSNDKIIIDFLDEQFEERKTLSQIKRENALKRTNPEANAEHPFADAHNREKRRERKEEESEERRIEKIGEGSVCVSIKSKYLNLNPVQIFDLEKYFESTNQLKQIQGAGWGAKFSDFLKDNPARVFDDEDHLYNSFKKYATEPTINGKKQFKPSFNLKDI